MENKAELEVKISDELDEETEVKNSKSEMRENVERMNELVKQRDADFEAYCAMEGIREKPPLWISLISLGLVGGGVYLSTNIQQPTFMDPVVITALVMVTIGVTLFYSTKNKIDYGVNKRKRLKDLVDIANVELKELSQKTGKPFPKMKRRKGNQ